MEEKELMIGDWLYCSFSHEPCQLLGIELYELTGYTFVKVTNVVGAKDIASLSPIPLTSEILKKNGFKNISKELFVYYSHAADGYIKIRLSELLDGEWKLSVDNYDRFNDSHKQYTSDICFLKVHELQHALRLCGIKKEIVLL